MKKMFPCQNCGRQVLVNKFMGTHHRNHCPYCLWSKHVDKEKPGERAELCQGMMKPVALTFKKVKPDKYVKDKKGELMIVHLCQKCGKVSINRVAADDNSEKIIEVLENSFQMTIRPDIEKKGIEMLSVEDKEEVETQLFGKVIVKKNAARRYC